MTSLDIKFMDISPKKYFSRMVKSLRNNEISMKDYNITIAQNYIKSRDREGILRLSLLGASILEICNLFYF
ncbi:MAG: hypothetical protein KJ721_01395 [Nanoarchaeota archaeon]|nr:hypothetical protein [Nanoarchaeota archaeon]